MELFEVLNNFCHRNSGAVSREDKIKHSYIIRRLVSSQYPIQCELMNRLDSDALCSTNIMSLLLSRYTDIPSFLKTRVDQKKKKETIRKFFEDNVINKYMEINECGIREVEEAYEFNPKEITESMTLIKNNYFNNKESVIINKNKPKKVEEETKLF